MGYIHIFILASISFILAMIVLLVVHPPKHEDGWTIMDREIAKLSSSKTRDVGLDGVMMFGNSGGMETRQIKCSTRCECTTGGFTPYGRYCGFGYTGCNGVSSCDDADECCRIHDACVTAYGLTDCNCTVEFTKCQACVVERALRKIGSDTWGCPKKITASIRMAADVKFILPRCYEEARHEARSIEKK